jgi:hypothetical protein
MIEGLSYCNRCGANLSISKAGGANSLPERPAEPIVWGVWALVVVTIALAGIMLGSIPVMKHAGLPQGAILLFVGLLFLILLAVDSVLAWQLFRLTGSGIKSRNVAPPVKLDTNDFGPKREQALLEPRMSVTENTTRNFGPVYEERKNRE